MNHETVRANIEIEIAKTRPTTAANDRDAIYESFVEGLGKGSMTDQDRILLGRLFHEAWMGGASPCQGMQGSERVRCASEYVRDNARRP